MTNLRRLFQFVFFWVLALLMALLPMATLASPGSIGLLGAAWNHTNIAVRVNVGQGVDPEVVAAVLGAISEWNSAIDNLGNPETADLEDFSLVVIDKGKADITIVLQLGKNPLDPTVGLAKWWTRGDGSFFRVDIKLMGQEMGNPYSATFVGTVTRHELGHALGLDHADFSELMYPTVVLGDPVSVCDKAAFATVHAWYLGTFSPPSATSVSCD